MPRRGLSPVVEILAGAAIEQGKAMVEVAAPIAEQLRRLAIPGWEDTSRGGVARVLDHAGGVVAVVSGPARIASVEALRDDVLTAVLGADFGDVVLAGVAFEADLGGDAVGFT